MCFLTIGREDNIGDVVEVGTDYYTKEIKESIEHSLKDNIKNREDLVAKNVHIGSYKYDEKNIIIISCKPLNKDIYAEEKMEKYI